MYTMTVTYAIRHEVLLNPVVRSWIQHYGAFYRTAPLMNEWVLSGLLSPHSMSEMCPGVFRAGLS